MKLESLVIANQNVAVNTFPGLVHTARHTMGVRWQTNEFWGAQFSVGTVNGRNLRQDIWYSMYVVVARCNRMLENIDKVSDMTEADRRRYIGYVHFMPHPCCGHWHDSRGS